MTHTRSRLAACLLLALGSAWSTADARKLGLPDRLDLEGRAAPNAALGSGTLSNPDEVGRAAQYLGQFQSGLIDLETDCTPDPANPLGPDDRCVLLNPAPAATLYSFQDLGRITLAARATKTLICAAITPVYSYGLYNPLAGPANAVVQFRPTLRVESTVLNDPAAIDPTTGLPYGGHLDFGQGGNLLISKTLAAGATETVASSFSRQCISGLSRQQLIDGYGLSPSLADKFFRNPITIRINANGRSVLGQFGSVVYGVRLYGD